MKNIPNYEDPSVDQEIDTFGLVDVEESDRSSEDHELVGELTDDELERCLAETEIVRNSIEDIMWPESDEQNQNKPFMDAESLE